MTPMKLGILCNELFDLPTSRKGGFGWAASQVARVFREEPGLGVEVVILLCEDRQAPPGEVDRTPTGERLIVRRGRKRDYQATIRKERFDWFLSIDFRTSYWATLLASPRTPVVLWVRDPRTPEDWARIRSLRLPGQPDTEPQGVVAMDCTSFRWVFRLGRWLGHKTVVAVTSPFLRKKVPSVYGVNPASIPVLPNIIELPGDPQDKSPVPLVMFLARLDPYKRPWLFVELARQFPDVTFVALGQSHFHGPGAWDMEEVPPNLSFVPHNDGAEKVRLLKSSWVLVNTSIHEGLAVSFLEALAAKTPLLSLVNPEELVSRFGTYVEWVPGDGEAALPGLKTALNDLLRDRSRREALGEAGYQWVSETHNREQFLKAFGKIWRDD